MMPRYYYHVKEGGTLIPDLEGVEVPTARSALEEAEQAARDLMADRVKHGQVIDGKEFQVCDEFGTLFFIVPFKSALKIDLVSLASQFGG